MPRLHKNVFKKNILHRWLADRFSEKYEKAGGGANAHNSARTKYRMTVLAIAHDTTAHRDCCRRRRRHSLSARIFTGI